MIPASADVMIVCEGIDEAIKGGVPERQAIAEEFLTLDIEAQSFDAAHKRLTRLFREYRKTAGQEPA